MNTPWYWCPICHDIVPTDTVREIYTGPPGETIRNHYTTVLTDGRFQQINHTVTRRQIGGDQ